jgi:hypothetical protein
MLGHAFGHQAGLMQLLQAAQPGCSTVHYHRKSMKTMNFHWFLLISIDFH